MRPASAITMVLHAHPNRCGGVPCNGGGLLRKYILHASFFSGHPVRIECSVLEARASVWAHGCHANHQGVRRRFQTEEARTSFATCKLAVYWKRLVQAAGAASLPSDRFVDLVVCER